MCGIAGILAQPLHGDDLALGKRMMDRIAHRGPDGEGMFSTDAVFLGHRRLSIIDIATGAQPMHSVSGRSSIVFNGEIYNYRELREDLLQKGWRFVTNSDTEVVLNMYEALGTAMLAKLNGMFAFGLYDHEKHQLILARDRLGKKPLFYHSSQRRLSFCSELPGLLEDPDISREPDYAAIGLYLHLLYVPGSTCAFKRVHKVLPGEVLTFNGGGQERKRYWVLPTPARPRVNMLTSGKDKLRVIQEMRALLSDSIRLRLRSDVPVGLFLSGGVDSSVIATLLPELHHSEIRAYTVGFGSSRDEVPWARLIAERNGIPLTEISVTPNVASDLPAILSCWGEPFADSSAIPSYYVSREARQHVKVVLNGDGGDELFGGCP